jgi:hypothetical protein
MANVDLSNRTLMETVRDLRGAHPKYERNAVEHRELAREILRLRKTLSEIAGLIVAPRAGQIERLVVFDAAIKDAFVEKARLAVNAAREVLDQDADKDPASDEALDRWIIEQLGDEPSAV